MSEFSCHLHAIYDRKCPKCIPVPPTAEYRPKRSPPPPPPLRNPNAGHDHSEVFVWVAVMMLCVAFGVLMGWKMHG